jgi:site-specific DNA-cytosine methylase
MKLWQGFFSTLGKRRSFLYKKPCQRGENLTPNMRIVSLFSGAGGLDLGMINAGHQIIWANDNDPDAVATYRKNIGNHIVEGDISNFPSEQIPSCDVVVGGFPSF